MIFKKITLLVFLVMIIFIAYQFNFFRQKILQSNKENIIQNQKQQVVNYQMKFKNFNEIAVNEAKSN
jgi:hypothetical protein